MKILFKIVLEDKTSLLVIAENAQDAENKVDTFIGEKANIKSINYVAREVEDITQITSTKYLIV